jgi:hypothetical protein
MRTAEAYADDQDTNNFELRHSLGARRGQGGSLIKNFLVNNPGGIMKIIAYMGSPRIGGL